MTQTVTPKTTLPVKGGKLEAIELYKGEITPNLSRDQIEAEGGLLSALSEETRNVGNWGGPVNCERTDYLSAGATLKYKQTGKDLTITVTGDKLACAMVQGRFNKYMQNGSH